MCCGALRRIAVAASHPADGYIYADAKRRGMNALLWTLLAMLLPKPIGFIAYFLLRGRCRCRVRIARIRLAPISPTAQVRISRWRQAVRGAAAASGETMSAVLIAGRSVQSATPPNLGGLAPE